VAFQPENRTASVFKDNLPNKQTLFTLSPPFTGYVSKKKPVGKTKIFRINFSNCIFLTKTAKITHFTQCQMAAAYLSFN
jgi:hypothetical protein